ncbi:hypothetical protein K3U94_09125 [Mycolicibacter heraklionensis]|uniref:Uncharacterized protein n=1 Tax=Mycolicibacter heraklionensis TaxID=512402 RepID=A0A9X7WKM6_9MYCO|nr:hypothetical protein [Mycolicibacter heraklionensis]QZA09372.1 hypothetical protein K3U94_09125 [Mycolicibacter heraklionensis]
MSTFPTPDEPTRPSPPVPPDRAPTGQWGVPPSTSPQLTPSGRSAKPAGVRAVLWAALLVLIGVIALLIVLSA